MQREEFFTQRRRERREEKAGNNYKLEQIIYEDCLVIEEGKKVGLDFRLRGNDEDVVDFGNPELSGEFLRMVIRTGVVICE